MLVLVMFWLVRYVLTLCDCVVIHCRYSFRQIQNSCREKGLLSLDLLPIACRRVDMLVNLDQSALDDHALQWMQATVSAFTIEVHWLMFLITGHGFESRASLERVDGATVRLFDVKPARV